MNEAIVIILTIQYLFVITATIILFAFNEGVLPEGMRRALGLNLIPFFFIVLTFIILLKKEKP